MTEASVLTLEILSGPLDGEKVKLQQATEWTRAGTGVLSFPWDEQLGAPQARLVPGPEGWTLAPLDAPQATSLINRDQKVSEPVRLETGDVIRAGTSWLRVLASE